MTIGILAVQGAFVEHEKVLDTLGIHYIELRQKSDLLKPIQGLILPGGESTVQGKLLKELDMFEDLQKMIQSGIPVLATCAGMILLAEHLSNDNNQYFGTIPMTVKRNAYGRQLGSFCVSAPLEGIGEVPMTFIRAPYVENCNPDVSILATVGEKTVAVKYKNQIALAFHPELNEDTRIHSLFIRLAETQS